MNCPSVPTSSPPSTFLHSTHVLLFANQQEEQRQKAIELELKSLRELQFRKQEDLHQNRQQEKTIEAEIQVCSRVAEYPIPPILL